MNETMTKRLSEQANAEWASAYLYLAMSADCDRKGLKGFSHWLLLQAQEEMQHGNKFYQFILERGEAPVLTDIKASEKTEWATMTEMFEDVLAHEKKVTAMINEIATLAIQENDHATSIFNQWFITEQVEEEASADEILQTLKFVKEDPASVYNLDKELATRVLEPETE